MNTEVMFSKKSDEWATPQDFYDELNREFDFELDPCCTLQNRKCQAGITTNGLEEDWMGLRAFVNPPYSQLKEWVNKVADESKHALGVMLIPARTDTKIWHSRIWDNTTHKPRTGVEVRFVPGRIVFEMHLTTEEIAAIKALQNKEPKVIAKKTGIPLGVVKGVLEGAEQFTDPAPFPSAIIIFRPAK